MKYNLALLYVVLQPLGCMASFRPVGELITDERYGVKCSAVTLKDKSTNKYKATIACRGDMGDGRVQGVLTFPDTKESTSTSWISNMFTVNPPPPKEDYYVESVEFKPKSKGTPKITFAWEDYCRPDAMRCSNDKQAVLTCVETNGGNVWEVVYHCKKPQTCYHPNGSIWSAMCGLSTQSRPRI